MPPVMNDTMIGRLSLTGYSKQHLNDTSALEQCLATLTNDREMGILCLVEELYNRYCVAAEVSEISTLYSTVYGCFVSIASDCIAIEL